MTTPTASSAVPVPSEFDDEVDDVALPFDTDGPTLAGSLVSRLRQDLEFALQLPPPLV